jgi:hypothetical protein
MCFNKVCLATLDQVVLASSPVEGSIPIPQVGATQHHSSRIEWCNFTFYLINIVKINGKLDFTSLSVSHKNFLLQPY